MTSKIFPVVILLGVALGMSGCASYTTPGGPVDLTGIQSADIREIMSREAAAKFPSLVSFARVQSPDYESQTAKTYGDGSFVVVTNRELMSDARIDEISEWTGIRSVSPLSRLLIPSRLNTIDELRVASASLKSDVLIVFTLDTSFRVDGKSIGPLSVISLGLMRDRETAVNTTASAVFVDVRSGFIFGVAEATASEKQSTSAWGSINAADQGRLNTEQTAFDGLIRELDRTWKNIIAEHGQDST